MALKDKISLGMALPHRSPEPIDMAAVRRVAQRAEALGFRDLWVTENTLDHVFCFDPVVVLTYAAAVTTTIRLGASVVVMAVHSPLMIAHQWACLDYASNGRAILGVGLGRAHHYRQFEVPVEGRLTRFREELAVIRSLWSEQKTTFHGRFYNLDNEPMSPKPVQKPMPIWMGLAIRTRCAARPGSPMVGWVRAARALPPSLNPCRSCGRRWKRLAAIRASFRPRSGCLWRWTNAQRWPALSSTAGLPRSITTRRGLTPPASMVPRSRCARGWKSLSRWAPTISFSTPSPATPNSLKRWPRSSVSRRSTAV